MEAGIGLEFDREDNGAMPPRFHSMKSGNII